MIQKSKKTFLILSSIILGVFIIAVTAKVAGLFGSTISSKGDNGWTATLSVIPGFGTTQVQKGDISVDTSAFVATTTTDVVARKLITEYLTAQNASATSTISDADAKNIGNLLAQEVSLPQRKEYTQSDLNISSNNSHVAYVAYATALNNTLASSTEIEKAENDLTILISAMSTNNSSELNKLNDRAILYQKLISDLLSLKVPSSLAPIHLHLVQAYETLRSATVGLQSMLADPAIGTVALAQYREGTDGLNTTAKEFGDFFAKLSTQ